MFLFLIAGLETTLNARATFTFRSSAVSPVCEGVFLIRLTTFELTLCFNTEAIPLAI